MDSLSREFVAVQSSFLCKKAACYRQNTAWLANTTLLRR